MAVRRASRGGGAFLGLPGDEAAAGATPDFPGAGDALAVAGAQAGGGGGVDLGERGVQRRGAVFGQQPAGFGAGGLAAFGDVRDAVDQGGEIEPGAAAEDGELAVGLGFGHGGQRCFAPPGGVAGLGGGANAVEGVRGPGFFFGCGAGGDDA